MEEKRVELEPAVTIGDHELIPIAWTVGHPVVKPRTLRVAMCREALGVIVRDDVGLRVFLADGRVMTADELVVAHPSLAGSVAAL
jgi:hypothetical protein